MKKIHSAYINWFKNSYNYSAEQLGIYRFVFITIAVFIIRIPKYSDKIASFPEGFFNPPPLFSSFFNSIPSLIYFQVTDVIIFIGFFFVFIGFYTKFWGSLSALLIIINNGFIYSTGKIDHSFLIWFTLLVMSFSGWEKTFSIDSFLNKKIKIRNWLISLISMGIGFGFSVAGLIKLVSGWLSTSESMLRLFFLRNFYVQKKQDFLAPFLENFSFNFFWESGDWFTILFEIGFLFVIFRPALFRFFTLIAGVFHGLVILFFNIGFYLYIPMYLLFWLHLIPNKLIKKLNQFQERLTLNKNLSSITILCLIALFTLNYFSPNPPKIVLNIFLLSFSFISIFLLLFKPKLIFTDTHIPKSEKIIIYFDGVCNLCNSFIKFVLKRDNDNRFLFKTLQSTENKTEEFETIFIKKREILLDRSSAFLEIVRELKGYWSYLYIGIVVPKFIRDLVYKFVAKHRYKWFGKSDQCMIPTNDIKKKFI